MIRPCPDAVRCPGTDFPVTNFSSEAPDPPISIGYSSGTAPTTSFTHHGAGGPTNGPNIRSSGPSDPPGPLVTPDQAGTGTGTPYPPLDSDWDNASVTNFVEVTDPDENADDVAGNDNVDLLASNSGTPGSGGLTLPNGTRPTIYVNHPQTCTIRCSDGLPFSFTVPVGAFRAYDQASADRAAYNYACKQAARNRICLGNISAKACIGTAYSQTITADTASSPLTWEVIGGALPSWVTATAGDKTFAFTGTPTASDIGTTIFTVFAQDLSGFSMTKDYSITVMGVTSSTTLPIFTQNVAYSSQISAGGGTPDYTFVILSGNLPPGLTMNDEGLISGTPTVAPGLYPVFIGITDSTGIQCTETLAFTVSGNCDVSCAKRFRIKSYVDGLFSMVCSAAVGPAWDGTFPLSAVDTCNCRYTATGPGQIISGQQCLTPVLLPYDPTGPVDCSQGYYIYIQCAFGGATMWLGFCAHNNPTDCPSGIFVKVSGAAAAPLSLEIEEY